MTRTITTQPARFLALAALTLGAVGCGGEGGIDAAMDGGIDAPENIDAAMPPDAWAPPVPRTTIAAANAVAEGDPLFEGQQRFLYETWGVERLDGWPPTDWMLALMTREPDVFGNQYAAFGFTRDPDDDLPVGFKRGIEDRTRMRETCALCHVGRLPDGQLWLGMPNLDLDMARFRAEVSRRWEADGHAPLISATEASKAMAYGPGRTGAETGGYPVPVPADFPPYWLLGARTHLNYLGTGRDIRSEVYLSIFSSGAGAPDERRARVSFPQGARVDSFVAFMGAMESPPPPPQDAAMVAAGSAVFERERCGSCHNIGDVSMNGVVTYDNTPTGRERFPGDDMMFPRGSIRTSYLHRILIDGEPAIDASMPDAGPDDASVDAALVDAGDAGPSGVDIGRDDLLRFIVRNRLRVGASDGYRVQALEGVWASPPYLHNGSVPTLEDLLRPASERPVTFMRGDFVVDTRLPGNSNQGHEFGTAIMAGDRSALATYLRSL